MTQDARNVTAGSPVVTGGILAGPLGSPLPTDEAVAWSAAVKPLGYAADGGVEPTGDAEGRNDIKAWGQDVVATVVTDKATRKFKFTLIEVFNPDVAAFVFGEGNVTTTAATTTAGTKIAILDRAESLEDGVIGFDMAYKGKRMRLVCPVASITVNEQPYTDEGLAGYECEITCLPDENGVRVYRYYANTDLVSA